MTEIREVVDILGGEIAPGIGGWSVITRAPDGSLHQITFPQATMEWRAAEYGLTDPAEILDVILHEPGVQPPTQDAAMVSLANPQPKRPAAQAPRDEPVTLYQATSTTAARAAHRTRIAAVKAGSRSIADPQALLRHIVAGHGMTADGIRVKREAVDVRRWRNLYGALPITAAVVPPQDDTARLRAIEMRAHQEGADRA